MSLRPYYFCPELSFGAGFRPEITDEGVETSFCVRKAGELRAEFMPEITDEEVKTSFCIRKAGRLRKRFRLNLTDAKGRRENCSRKTWETKSEKMKKIRMHNSMKKIASVI